MEKNSSPSLKEIEEKIAQAKSKYQSKPNIKEPKRPSAMDICAELMAPIIVGAFLGNYLDKEFATWPWWFLILFILGVITGGFAVYRTSKKFED
jgi:F0F1-type ATP synthase assembly protein I